MMIYIYFNISIIKNKGTCYHSIFRGNINGNCDRDEAANYFGVKAEQPVVLLVGGRQGALGINKGISAQLGKFKESDMQLIWQTGKFYYEQAQKEIHELQLTDKVKPVIFIDRMDLAYSLADVVISRAGAMSISELALVQKPVIFVPLPTAAEDHQTKNAQALVDKDAAIMIPDSQAEAQLMNQLVNLIQDEDRCKTMGENILKLAQPDAIDLIIKEILS